MSLSQVLTSLPGVGVRTAAVLRVSAGDETFYELRTSCVA
jgi:hypothetical protein